MKKLMLSLSLVLSLSILLAQEPVQVGVASAGPQLTIDKEVHDYGTLEQGAPGGCEFLVTNTGDSPLILNRCKGSCGCTVPECTGEPILPGGSTVIKVNYDTKRIGPINKSVTIESNAKNTRVKTIKIKGTIIKPPNGSPELTPAGPTAK
ncbi:DUF1573 domain-containing protein [Flavobacteriales bacterium]|nr:DUF1573 domain-containing protein [Flavobacteriales bacterium]